MTSDRIDDDLPTWVVLVRDISGLAAATGEGATFVSLVLDQATGLARGIGVGATASEARTVAMTTAASTALEPFTSSPAPGQVLCQAGEGTDLAADLADLFAPGPVPPVTEVYLAPEAEDILDELVGHLSGREMPSDLPQPDDWTSLVSRTLEYAQAEPWRDWPDELQLRLVVTVEGGSASYVVAVIGRDGLQAGLVLYPGRDKSDVIIPDRDWQPDDQLPFVEGTVLLHLNPPEDTLDDMAAKARRYGWPEDTPRMPVWLSAGPDGFADLDRIQAGHLSLALAAVLARHRRPGPPKKAAKMTGRLALPGDAAAAYSATDL